MKQLPEIRSRSIWLKYWIQKTCPQNISDKGFSWREGRDFGFQRASKDLDNHEINRGLCARLDVTLPCGLFWGIRFARSVDTMGGGAQLCKTSKAGAAEVVVVPAKVGQL